MKKYNIVTTPRFDREMKKLDKYTAKIIQSWISKNLVDCEDPRRFGKGLVSNRSGQWRYRIGDYRILCEIQDSQLVILALSVGHRREVYD